MREIVIAPISLISWALVQSAVKSGRARGESKNAGYSHDVDENKGKKNVGIGGSHDVDENKQLALSMPRC